MVRKGDILVLGTKGYTEEEVRGAVIGAVSEICRQWCSPGEIP